MALKSVLNKGILQVLTYTEEGICLSLLIGAKLYQKNLNPFLVLCWFPQRTTGSVWTRCSLWPRTRSGPWGSTCGTMKVALLLLSTETFDWAKRKQLSNCMLGNTGEMQVIQAFHFNLCSFSTVICTLYTENKRQIQTGVWILDISISYNVGLYRQIEKNKSRLQSEFLFCSLSASLSLLHWILFPDHYGFRLSKGWVHNAFFCHLDLSS